MKFAETFRSLSRRWYVVLLGLALTAGLGLVVDLKVPATFQTTGTILLMPPEATVGVNGNPYLYLGGLNTALDVLVRRSSAVEVIEPVLQRHPGADYTVAPDRTTSSAIVIIEAEAGSPGQALQLRDDSMESVLKTLSQMQDEVNVESDLRIQGQPLVVDKTASPKTKTRFQLLVFVAGGGTVGTLLLASLIDGWLISRKLTRAQLETSEPTQPAKRSRTHPGKPPRQSSKSQPRREAGPVRRSTAEPLQPPGKNGTKAAVEEASKPLKVP